MAYIVLQEMDKTAQDQQSMFFRILEWPLSIFIGLGIGILIAYGIIFWDSTLHNLFEPTGIHLFLSGWVIILAVGFGECIHKVINIASASKRQRLIRRSLIAVGIILNVIACTLYTTI